MKSKATAPGEAHNPVVTNMVSKCAKFCNEEWMGTMIKKKKKERKQQQQAQTTWKLRESFTQEVAAEVNPE